ncbi:MAG: bactofilin [Gemmatimonadetes bacterium]|nr:bactofilin [Gemmatimonadota bacterium]
MSLFQRSSSATVPPASAYSVFDARLTVHGDVTTEGTLRVDGQLQGTIHQADTVIIGVGATVVGDVNAREVIVGGTVHGNISATERVELQSSGVVAGDIDSAAILVQEGGAVQGRLAIRPQGSAERLDAGTQRQRLAPSYAAEPLG